MMRIAAAFVLLAAQQAPPAAQGEKPLKVMMALQDPQARYEAQLLGDLDRPVDDGIVLGTTQYAAEVDDKGNLRIDTKAEEKYRTITKREIVSFQVKGETDKSRTATLKLEIRKREDGTWVYRNLTQLTVQIGQEAFVVVDANGNGAYNDPRADGMTWQGHTWLFPLPSSAERWCTPTMEIGAFEFGTLGENPTAKGKPLATTVPAALPVLKGVNEERVKLGLTPRPEDVKLSAELQKHCVYMQMNNILTHPEEAGKPGYSKEGHEAGMRSILSRGMDAAGVAHGMVGTYFHRQDVIRPHTIAFGVGYEGSFGGIDGRSAMGKAPPQYWPVLCPVPGQQNVGLNYGKEAPDACPGDAAAGYPITVYFGTGALKLTSSSLKAVGGAPAPRPQPGQPAAAPGGPVDCYLYDPTQGASKDMTGYQHCVCIIPKDPLRANTEYEVTLAVDVAGKPWTKTWRFTTGAGGRGGFGPER
jgi:hypothetical protein